MKLAYKILVPSFFLALVIIFYTVIPSNLPEFYNKITETITNILHVPVQTAEALLLLGGFVLSLVFVLILLFIIYQEIKRRRIFI